VPSALKADYFALFGLPSLVSTGDASGSNVDPRNVFSVNPQELRNRFLHMQKLCHPDRWAQKGQVSFSSPVCRNKSNKSLRCLSQEAAEAAASQSALLNKAYQTLLSPRTRGEYILSQQGVDILEADNMDEEQDLMLQVMEAREELEDAEGDEVKELLEINRRAYSSYPTQLYMVLTLFETQRG